MTIDARPEAELLRALKPKFNRAGRLACYSRLLVLRCTRETLEMAINETPALGWQGFGRVVHYHAPPSLLRHALNPVFALQLPRPTDGRMDELERSPPL
ncbi:MAG: hypothetical protein V9H26_05630 [Verrucomicrobiota bacterium]